MLKHTLQMAGRERERSLWEMHILITLVRGEDGNRISVSGRSDCLTVIPEELAPIKTNSNKAWFRIHVYSNQECSFSYSIDGTNFSELGGHYRMISGTWIGAKVGVFCSSSNILRGKGYADFD